jgi:hypothetical protein
MTYWRYRKGEEVKFTAPDVSGTITLNGRVLIPAGEQMYAGQAIQRGADDRYYLASLGGFRGFVCEDVKPGQMLEEVNPGTFRVYRPEEDQDLWRAFRRDFARRRNRRAFFSMVAVLVAAAIYYFWR